MKLKMPDKHAATSSAASAVSAAAAAKRAFPHCYHSPTARSHTAPVPGTSLMRMCDVAQDGAGQKFTAALGGIDVELADDDDDDDDSLPRYHSTQRKLSSGSDSVKTPDCFSEQSSSFLASASSKPRARSVPNMANLLSLTLSPVPSQDGDDSESDEMPPDMLFQPFNPPPQTQTSRESEDGGFHNPGLDSDMADFPPHNAGAMSGSSTSSLVSSITTHGVTGQSKDRKISFHIP